MSRTILFGLGFAMAVVLATPSAKADYINLTADTAGSTEHLGNFAGKLEYSSSSATAATLTVTLKNTSPANKGGYITAFVFNNPSDLITDIALNTAPANFSLVENVNGAPFGTFDFGASTGDKFEGGGSPSKGLGVGQTGTFTFALTGTHLNTLKAASFANALSSSGSEAFVVRFRGFSHDGSDKVPANFAAVPEPAPVALLGLGMGTAGLYALRRRKSS